MPMSAIRDPRKQCVAGLALDQDFDAALMYRTKANIVTLKEVYAGCNFGGMPMRHYHVRLLGVRGVSVSLLDSALPVSELSFKRNENFVGSAGKYVCSTGLIVPFCCDIYGPPRGFPTFQSS